MFLHIDALQPGDIVIVYVLGEKLVYQVYSQEIIHPSEYGKLAVIPGEDILTLLTCTLDLINPDRVLVNAVRVETSLTEETVSGESPFAETHEETATNERVQESSTEDEPPGNPTHVETTTQPTSARAMVQKLG